MGKLIIFSAPSGSGKSTIINYLLTQNLNLAFLSPQPAVRHAAPNGMVWNISSSLPKSSGAASPMMSFWNTKKCIRTAFTER